jgi:glycosyltransferase involved in cell wall biosynthesis
MNNNSKKITILLPFFRDGGVERVMINLAQGFLDKNFEVDFLFMTDAVGPLKKEIPSEVNIVEFHKSGVFGSTLSTIRYLRKNKTEVLLSALTPANIVAILAKWISIKSVKVIISVPIAVHTTASTTPLKAKLRPLFYKFFYKKADAIVAVSKGVAEDLLLFHIPANLIHTIYNPIISLDIEKRSQEPVSHPWFGLNDVPVILAVGRLHKQKDFPTLLRAFAQVVRQQPARLIILGEGEERQMLNNLVKELNIENTVELAGFVQNPYSYMKSSNVFVLSSAWEGFGNVVAEALAVGTPVVSTDCPWGPAEILDHGKYGMLVPIGEPIAMANAIITMLNKHPDSILLKESAQRFSIPTITEEYINLINSL